MAEKVAIKCHACGEKFYKKQIGAEPIVLHCKCKNLMIEIKTKDEEDKKMFIISFGDSPPLVTLTELK